jgi:hypothetical protein
MRGGALFTRYAEAKRGEREGVGAPERCRLEKERGEGRPVAMWRQGGRGGLAGDRQVVRPDPGSDGRGRAGDVAVRTTHSNRGGGGGLTGGPRHSVGQRGMG